MTITVVNHTGSVIFVAVAVDTGKNDGSYFRIENDKDESWSRQGPGSTVFVQKGGLLTGSRPDVYFVAADQPLVVN